jgi:TP901 family phage tail tape measure protein
MAAESSVRILFLSDTSSALRGVRTMESSFGSLGRTARLAGTAIAAGIVGGFALAVKSAVEFDKEMRNVNSIARLSEGRFKALSKSVLGLAKDSGQAPSVLAKGLYDIVSSGFKADKGIKILRVSARAATAGLTDTATATKAVVAALNAYHLGAEDATKVGDVLFQTVNKGVLTFEELSQQIGDVLPAASTLGVPLTAVGGALATITLHGVNAAEAATQVKQVLVSMLKPSDELQGQFKKMGYESGQAALKQLGLVGVITKLSAAAGDNKALIADWFPNVRALSGFFGLAGKNIQTFTQNVDAMGQRGALAKAFAEQGKSIAVQWQKAKAALTAAAVPVGNLLFPALASGAEKVQAFATSIQQNMPVIRREFGDLARVSGDAARGILGFAKSAEGLSVITGVAAGLGFAKVVTGLVGIISGLAAINPLLALAAGAVSILAGGMLYLYLKSHQVSEEFKNALQAIRSFSDAMDERKQSAINYASAITSQKAAHLAVRAAIRERNAAERDAGRDSERYKQAVVGVERAYQSLAQSNLDVTRTTKAKTDAEDKAGAESRKYNKALNDLAQTHRHVLRTREDVLKQNDNVVRAYYQAFRAAGANASAEEKMRAGLAAANKEMAKKDSVGYARDLSVLAEQMHKSGLKTWEFVAATAALADALGRIPTHKEVTLIVRLQGAGNLGALEGGTTSRSRRSRARGGFIPGASGEAVPIMAHAGEIVLNPSQQATLGGPRFLADLFGFSGDEGPGFAGGGIVRKPKGKGSKRSPRGKKRRPRLKKLRGIAQGDIRRLEAIDQHEADLDRDYGLKAREYDQTQEVYIVTDPATGVDSIDWNAVNHRLGEIDSLISLRNDMLTTLDEEKEALDKAISDLRKVIAALQAQIRSEIADARRDEAAVERLANQIAAERRKKKPNQSLIDRWTRQRDRHQDAARTHRAHASDLSSTANDYAQTVGDQVQNLRHVLPFDRRDVELDIGDLQGERVLVAGTALPPSQAPGGGDTGGSDDQRIADLLRQIGLLNLALGIQGVQTGIIGSFKAGTLHVPETGLAMVHAGERITPAGVAIGGDGASIGDMNFNVVLEGDMAALGQFIKVKAVEASPQINQRQNRDFDTARRAGVLR